jgi:two-component system copper resistance phosphate regulon response regulator CusR
MRILLLEPEINTADWLRKGLAENGFAVDIARQGSEARDLVCRTDYDLLVCDDVNKSRGLASFPETGQRTPVLFLADMAKPFAFSDVLMRLRLVLHTAPGGIDETLRIADLEIGLVRHRACRAGKRLDLTPKEFLLLSLLMRRTGDVLSRTEIADQIWDINFDTSTNFVDVHIRRLRSKVDDPFPNKLIHTVRGAGYVLEERA